MSRVLFVGVSTAGSRIHALFPRWMDALGLDVTLEGVDIPLDAPPSVYQELVAAFPADESLLGAVITSHKLSIYAAARELIQEADEEADALREFNAIARRHDGSLSGHARDPLALQAVLPSVLGEGFDGDVVLFGAGGAGSAIAKTLQAPRRLVVVDVVPERIDALRAQLGPDAELVVSRDATANDALVAGAAPGSLIVNATGMGKDRPGAPITPAVEFPPGAVAWDLNYRGELDFLAIARAAPDVTTFDGYEYFLVGWAAALSPVLGVDVASVAMLK